MASLLRPHRIVLYCNCIITLILHVFVHLRLMNGQTHACRAHAPPSSVLSRPFILR